MIAIVALIAIADRPIDVFMRPLTHALPGAIAQLLRDTPLSDGKVGFAWRAAVGPALERATKVKLVRKILIVETSSLQWSREVKRSSPMILKRLQALLGADVVDRIEVRRA
jgi:Dna[CI] antecedent, DciA